MWPTAVTRTTDRLTPGCAGNLLQEAVLENLKEPEGNVMPHRQEAVLEDREDRKDLSDGVTTAGGEVAELEDDITPYRPTHTPSLPRRTLANGMAVKPLRIPAQPYQPGADDGASWGWGEVAIRDSSKAESTAKDGSLT